MRWFNRLTLSRQFLVASFPILLVGMVIIGLWVEREIERGILSRISEVQSLYIDSLVAPHLSELFGRDAIDARQKAALDALFVDTALGRQIVAFIIWRPDGRILYSNEADLIGRVVPVGRGLRTALAGTVDAKVIDRRAQPHPHATPDWPERLIETYAPIHATAGGAVVGAAEFYLATAELDDAMHAARLRSWGVVAATMVAMYLLLFGLVRRGSETIVAQREELTARVEELSALAHANASLVARQKQAAARTTALNEALLRRVAADLHDGPAQDLGFAQMRIDAMGKVPADGSTAPSVTQADLAAVRHALALAMTDLRAICAGLQLPDLESLSVGEVAGRAVRDYESKTGVTVALECTGDAIPVALPIRITLFRVLQETLANGFRHGHAQAQRVRMSITAEELHVEVSDDGPGFDASTASTRAHGGLAGMRERVRALGGTFAVSAAPGAGTTVRVRLPTQVAEADDD